MNRVEELQGMTHEDLVRLVQEREETIDRLEKDKTALYQMYEGMYNKCKSLVNLLSSAAELAK